MNAPDYSSMWTNQLAATNRANNDAATWEENSQEWSKYAKQMEAKLNWVTEQKSGVNAVRTALLEELGKNLPQHSLNKLENRMSIFFDGVNQDRQERGLRALTRDEFNEKKYFG
ncbi:MAG: hypothetical protein Q7K26_01385 [bacterium]|nr:hypothetical protein [bacterium]